MRTEPATSSYPGCQLLHCQGDRCTLHCNQSSLLHFSMSLTPSSMLPGGALRFATKLLPAAQSWGRHWIGLGNLHLGATARESNHSACDNNCIEPSTDDEVTSRVSRVGSPVLRRWDLCALVVGTSICAGQTGKYSSFFFYKSTILVREHFPSGCFCHSSS